MPVLSFDRIVSLINEATQANDFRSKVTSLLQVKELLIHRESSLLDNFFEEVVKFQHDANSDVKKVVIGFIQDACLIDPGLLKRAVGSLYYLFSSAVQQEPPAFSVLRALMTAIIPIYRTALTRAVKVGIIDSGVSLGGGAGIVANSAADIALETFRSVAGIKDEVVRLMLPQAVTGQPAFTQLHPALINDAIRIQAISLIEEVIILHSRRLPNSDIPPENENNISLDQIPVLTNTQLQNVLEASTASSSATLLPGVCLVRPHRLAEEAERLFTGLSSWPVRGKPSVIAGSITCPVLEALMDSLVKIAKQRPQYMDRVVQAFETVHVTLPPHFSDNQVGLVRRKLKTGLLQLLRHPAAIADFQGRITILLTDLGATQMEVLQALQSHSGLSRTRLYPDSGDHGDVDMRQRPMVASLPPVSSTSSSCAYPSNTTTTTTSNTGTTIAGDSSITVLSDSKKTKSSTNQDQVSIDSDKSLESKSSASSVPISTSMPSSSLVTLNNQPTEHRLSSGFSLVEAEAALRFDDDDDDDEDDDDDLDEDIRVPRSSRRTKRKNSLDTSVNSSNIHLIGNTTTLTTTNSNIMGNSFKMNIKTGMNEIKSGENKPTIDVDFITSRLVPRLTTANVTDLVLLSMVTLPDQMPASFHSTYTPIAAAGTTAQIRHLARMLAVQLNVWATECGSLDSTDHINQIETLLTFTEDELAETNNNTHNANINSISSHRKSSLKMDSHSYEQLDVDKEVGRSKKRRLGSFGDKSIPDNDAEAEDALIRANAAKRLHGTQPMNISTLVGYNTQQTNNEVANSNLPRPELTGMVPSMFSTIPPPVLSNMPIATGTTGVSALSGTGISTLMMMPNFNPCQPPPLLPMMVPNMILPSPTSVVGQFNQYANTSMSMPLTSMPMSGNIVPTSCRPFSLDAVTTFLSRDVQRQLAHDAFRRIIDGLETTSNRRQLITDGSAAPAAGIDSVSTLQELNRMKLLTRLTNRRFGGNEFYEILIDYAIKNMRFGYELLSKLLMQDYCRYRGFQLGEFQPFIESRRQYIVQMREQARNKLDSSTTVPTKTEKSMPAPSTTTTTNNNKTTVVSSVDTANVVTSSNSSKRKESDANSNNEKPSDQSKSDQIIESDNSEMSSNTEQFKVVDEKYKDLEHKNEEQQSNKSDVNSDFTSTIDSVTTLNANNIENDLKSDQHSNMNSDKSHTRKRHRSKAKDRAQHQQQIKLPTSSPDGLGCLSFYDCLLSAILQKLSNPDVRQHYFGRFLIEAPLLTAGAIGELKRYCTNPEQAAYGFEILCTLIETRPVNLRQHLINILLHFCSVENSKIRHAALSAIRGLSNSNPNWKYHIEEFAIQMLKKLLQPRPSSDIFPFANQTMIPSVWTDEACQTCAHLFLGLMPQIPKLMHKLAEVYTQASPNVKRCLLRMVDGPVREIGIYSEDLHNLVDECPTGAETLVTRMIHILTDWPSATSTATSTVTTSTTNTSTTASTTATTLATSLSSPTSTTIPNLPKSGQLGITNQLNSVTTSHAIPAVIVPPPSLVERVYRLYVERIHDVRCLIPVIVGLSKQDVITALPRLVQLNEKVVKEVLTRLLNASVSTQYAPRIDTVKNVPFLPLDLNQPPPLGPLKPEELLVAVHLLEFAKDPSSKSTEDKSTKPYVNLQSILLACRVCLAERRLFTQERLSVTIGQLLEQPILPTLFMRTVMQALALHPRLTGYVINVLVRLIRKQVWKSDKLWDGFIRCCVKTRPQSYQVLLQLPPDRLENVFERDPTLRNQVKRYVQNFSSAQRIHISKAIVDVLERVPTPPQPSTPKQTSKIQSDNLKLTESIEHSNIIHSISKNSNNKNNDNLENSELPLSPPPSPSSSGPGTPTRDELPSSYDTTATLMAASMFVQQNQQHLAPTLNNNNNNNNNSFNCSTTSANTTGYMSSIDSGNKYQTMNYLSNPIETIGSYTSPQFILNSKDRLTSRSNNLKLSSDRLCGNSVNMGINPNSFAATSSTPITNTNTTNISLGSNYNDDDDDDDDNNNDEENDHLIQTELIQNNIEEDESIYSDSYTHFHSNYSHHSNSFITKCNTTLIDSNENDINCSPPQITMNLSQMKKPTIQSHSIMLQDLDNETLDFEENSDPIQDSNQDNSNHEIENDDDNEPPILPSTSRRFNPSALVSLPYHQTKSTTEYELATTISSSSSNSSSFGTITNATTSGNNDNNKPVWGDTNKSQTVSATNRPKRPVDLNKLEADRKRLEEEAVKYKQLKAERRQKRQTGTDNNTNNNITHNISTVISSTSISPITTITNTNNNNNLTTITTTITTTTTTTSGSI